MKAWLCGVLLAVGLVGGVAHAGPDDLLWGKAEYGMTKKQVLQAYPDARDPGPSGIPNDTRTWLVVDNVDLQGYRFEAEFPFEPNGELRSVVLSLKQDVDTGSARLLAEQLAQLLTQKYGRPVKAPDPYEEKVTSFTLLSWHFRSGKTDVRLSMFGEDDAKDVSAFHLEYARQTEETLKNL